MSLYTHFSNKNELLDLVYAELARRLYADDQAPTTWQADLYLLCQHVRTVLVEHSRWIPLLARPSAPLPVPIRERLLRQMVSDGMTPDSAMVALTSALMTTIGLVLLDTTLREPDGQGAMSRRYERLRAWAETAPDFGEAVTKTALSRRGHLDVEENFMITIQSLISGFDANRRGVSSGIEVKTTG